MLLFIYGSCKKGFYNHSRFGLDKVPFKGTHIIKGFHLIDLGAYPGLINSPNGEGKVRGELYEVEKNSADFKILDKVERGANYTLECVEYHEDNPIYGYRFLDEGMRGKFIPEGEWT